MEIKYKKDWRKNPQWEKVNQMELRPGQPYPILHTDKFGWVLISNCTIRDGNFNSKDNPVPSIDNKIVKDIRDLLLGQIENSQGSEMDNREYMIEYLEKLLQNGVETDKEEPKYTREQIKRLCKVYFYGTKQLNSLLSDLG